MSRGCDTGRLPTIPAVSWLLAISLALGIDAFPVRSAPQGSEPRASVPVHAPGESEITLEQAALTLQERYGSAARVVRTDVLEQDGHHVYVFRMLSVNGRVWIVHIDARNGTEVP
jgi:hypothetical protein